MDYKYKKIGQVLVLMQQSIDKKSLKLYEPSNFLTVNPKNPSLALNKRKIIKESRGAIRRVIERYFVIDNLLITFFENEKDIDFKKNASLDGCFVFVESNQETNDTWHDRKCRHRVQIILPQRQTKPIFFYTNDLNEAKILAARIYMSSSTKRFQIQEMIRKLTFFEVIFRFQAVWRRIFKVYEKRLLRMISFQILGINLIELANTAWLQREKLFKFWSGQVLKREKIPLLRSTFRFGEIKKQLDPSLYKSSLMVREQILKLVRAFKNRKLQRHSAIQQDIQTLLEEEEQGANCESATLSYMKNNQWQKIVYPNANIKIENNKYLSLQNQGEMVGVDFYEKFPPIKFLLENIGFMATNFNMFDKQQDEYTLRIYGRTTMEKLDQSVETNLTPDDLGLDILRKQSAQLYQIRIEKIELPISYAMKFSLKADVRVKLRQSRNIEAIDKSFYINSRPYRISVPPQQTKGRLVINGKDFVFLIDQLDQFNPNEVFKISVVLQRTNVPVTQFMKEFLYEEEFTSEVAFKYEEAQKAEVKCQDQQGNKVKVIFSVEKVRNQDGIIIPYERDGLRLLVGRYIIYRKRVAILTQINRDYTVNLTLMATGQKKKNVAMKRIKMIERCGVNIYSLKNIPKAVQESQQAWILEFKTSNRRLVNLISSGIQNRQTYNAFSLRSYNRDKKRDIEGKIVISVIEVMNLKLPQNQQCNLFTKISVINEENFIEQFSQTSEIKDANNPSWVNQSSPSGEILDLGTFFYEQVKTIKFELFNRNSQGNNDQLIGFIDLKSTDFIDLQNPGKEKCLILSDEKQRIFTFLMIQGLFVATNVTRIEYQVTNDLSIYVSPEQYFHYLYLQKQHEIDDFKYSVPVAKFLPNYLEKMAAMIYNTTEFKSAIKGAPNQNDYSKYSASPLLFDKATNSPDKNSSPAIAILKQQLCSQEERLSIILKNQNFQRPDIEEGILIFKLLWKHRIIQTKQEAFIALQERFWMKYLTDMGIYAQTHPFMIQINEEIFKEDHDVSILDIQDRQFQPQSQIAIPGQQIFGWIKSKAGGQQQEEPNNNLIPQNVKQFNLIFNSIWENDSSQQYADAYYLLQSGVPQVVRVKIWKDLLKTEVLEYEETRIFARKYSQYYESSKTIYQNYKDMASKQDCLAFRQIDEDVESYQFPKLFYENESTQKKIVGLKEQKRIMRNILRLTVLWSRNKKLEGEKISYSYTKGLLHIIQRLITLADEEDAFWILNGMIRMIPRLFSTSVSCLTGGRNSVMRNEMTAFKAILRENLPTVCDKLRLLGLPVEHIIYDSMTSFYSHYFSSEVVLRLWDLIIFNLSNNDIVAKKRALWHFMAPAYLIFREKQVEIEQAQNIQQVVDLYNNGCSVTYDPEWIVKEVKLVIKDIFVTGIQRLQNNNQGGGRLTLGLNKLINRGVDKAQLLEETRKKYEADLSLIFNSIEEENQQIGLLLEKTNFKGNYQSPQYLDYLRWRTHVMARFKKVALKNSNEIHDQLYQYDEPEMDRNDLDLSKINVYLHQIINLAGLRLFKMRLYYGKVAEDGSFQAIEERFNDEDVLSDLDINQFYDFEYMPGYNFLKIEIRDHQTEDVITCELIVDLGELNNNRFLKKHFQMRNENLIENPDSYRYPFTVFVISFFLQTHTAVQLNEIMMKRNATMSNFINSIKRKLPDRIDIFNKKNETEFVQVMKRDFRRIIKEEFEALKCFLPEQQARNTINDNFNFIENSDFGNISLSNLQFLVKQCFFSEWVPHLDQLYKIFVKEQDNEENKNADEHLNDGEQTQQVVVMSETSENPLQQSMFNKLKKQLIGQRTPNERDELFQEQQLSKLPFSLRNFLVSLVLMSHCTINEKFDILYDLFDWNDGVADGLDMNSIFLLIKTIFERNLYYWPSHELFNLVEMAFDMSVSSVYQVFWTRDIGISQNRKSIKLSQLFQNPKLAESDLAATIDVTEEVQETLNSYQRMFGNKIIDFNFDSSAFKSIDVLIKNGKKMLDITNKIEAPFKYRLVVFYQVSSERYQLEVNYDNEGQLIKNRELLEKDDIDEYLKRNINKLYLCGRSKGISKQEFLQKTESIPFLQDLVRVETLYRDRIQSTLTKKKKLSKELVVLLNQEEFSLVFRFQNKIMSNVEGDLRRIDQTAYRILMMEANQQDVISDIRERMISVIEKMLNEKQKEFQTIDKEKLIMNVKGLQEFFVRQGSTKWKAISEFERLVQFEECEGNEIIMKIDSLKHLGDESEVSIKEEERDLAAFDCYSLYKHCDMSYEWRLCKIMQKEPIVSQGINSLAQNAIVDTQAFKKGTQKFHQFYYWIEFLHHRKMGQKIWLKRRREEILMSARYAREQQRNYEQETLKFIREVYKDQADQQSLLKGLSSTKKNLSKHLQ